MDFSEAWAQANQAAQAISTDAVRYSTKYGLREGVDPDFMDKLKDDYAPSTPASSYSPPTSINTGKTVEEEWTSFGDPVAQHQGAVTSVCLAERREEGPCIYTGGMDGKVKGWDVETGEMIVEFHDHKSTVTSLAAGLGKNVRAIYSAGLDGMLVVHENEHIHKLQVSRGIIGGIGIVQVPEDHSSPDQHAFVGLGNGIIKRVSYQDLPRTVIHPGEDAYKKEGAADAEFTKHNAPITGISAIKDDLFSAAKDGAIYRWSIKDQEVVSTYSVRGSPVTMLLLRTRLSVDYTVRDTVWAGFENGKVQRWDIESCDAVPGGDIAESGGPAVVNGVARQGHVYWADNEGVHDTDDGSGEGTIVCWYLNHQSGVTRVLSKGTNLLSQIGKGISTGSMGSMGFSAMPSVLSPTASSDAYHSASSTASSVWSSVVGGLSKKDSEEDQAKGVTRLKDGTVIARTDGDHTKAVSEFSNTRRQYEEERKRDAEVERQRKEAEAARAAALAAGGEAAAEPVPWGGGKPAAPKAGGFAAQKLAKWRVRAEDKKPGTQASEPKPFPGAAGAAQSKSTERGSGRAKSVEQSRTARGGFGGGGGEGGARWKQAKGNFLGRMKAGLNPKRKVAKHKYPLQWNPVKGRWGCDVCGKGMEGGGDRFRSTEPGVDFDSCRECFMKGELVK